MDQMFAVYSVQRLVAVCLVLLGGRHGASFASYHYMSCSGAGSAGSMPRGASGKSLSAVWLRVSCM